MDVFSIGFFPLECLFAPRCLADILNICRHEVKNSYLVLALGACILNWNNTVKISVVPMQGDMQICEVFHIF